MCQVIAESDEEGPGERVYRSPNSFGPVALGCGRWP